MSSFSLSSVMHNSLKRLLSEYQELPEFNDKPIIDVNQTGVWKSAPLHIAIYRRNVDEINILLDHGADPNKSGEYDELPLEIAIVTQNAQAVKLLLKAGAELANIKNGSQGARELARSMDFHLDFDRIISELHKPSCEKSEGY